MGTMGKGSKRRPLAVNEEEFNSEWDRIFGKRNPWKQSKSQQKRLKVQRGESNAKSYKSDSAGK
jgi:hypothetical protein